MVVLSEWAALTRMLSSPAKAISMYSREAGLPGLSSLSQADSCSNTENLAPASTLSLASP